MRSEVFALLKTGQNRTPTSNSPSARAVALSAIDEELDAARRLAHSLRSRRNTLASISFLPAELLSRIFHFRAREDTPWPAMGKYSWTAIAHVCQRWRQVALNDSSLWARLIGNRPSVEWVSEVLVRARNAPLTIDFMSAPRPGALSKLRSHIPHTRELRLRCLSMFDPHDVGVREICASEAPILEHFELGCSGGYPATILPPGTSLFDGWAPNLWTLTLSQVFIPCSLIPCGQLTQLKITYGQASPAEPPSPHDLDLNHLIDLLINNPGLEVLILEFCLPTILYQVSNRQSVHLPRLSRLCFSGFTSRVTNFKRLTLPSSATLRLQCISENHSAHPDHLILPHVSTHLYNLAPAEIKSFRVTASWSQSLVELATSFSTPKSTTYHAYVIERHMNSEAGLILSFEGVSNFGPSTQADILKRACSILPISNIEVLSIFAPEPVRSVDWYELFQHCKKVTTIKAGARGTASLLQALAPPKPTDMVPESKTEQGKRDNTAAQSQAVNNIVAAQATTTPFPELTSLLLGSLNFDYYVSGSVVLYDVIVDILRRRQANKTHLKTLHVDGCITTAERANSLKEYAQEFHWDEDEGEGYFDQWEDYDYSSGY